MRGKTLLSATMVVALVGVAGAALASDDESPTPPDETSDATDSWFTYDDTSEPPRLVYWLPDGDEPAPDCTSGDAGADLPDGCVEVPIEPSSDHITHGSVVSAFVHSLKDNEAYDRAEHGPRGQWVREIAQSDLGKDGTVEGDELEPTFSSSTVDDDEGDDHDQGGGPPAHARANGHAKKNADS